MTTGYVFYAGDEFAQSGREVEAYLKGRRFTVSLQDIGSAAIKKSIGCCDVAIFLSHGGWDGPMIWDTAPSTGGFDQIDPVETPGDWAKLKTYMSKFMNSNGLVATMACHSAGSNKWESTDGVWGERWVQQFAKDMDVYTTGVLGSTASANYKWAKEFVRYSLDGGRFAYQPAHAYKPGGVRDTAWRGWTNRAG